MIRVSFVILHYLSYEVTDRCIQSIKNKIKYPDYHIIVVDNGSGNGSGERLLDAYGQDKGMKILCLKDNIGFSAGNNVGYRYARERLSSDFIVVMNNDTEIIQEDFLERIINYQKQNPYYVLGPDIINTEGSHQSPQRNHIIHKSEAKKWLIKRYLFSKYLHLHKTLKFSDNAYFYRKYFQHDRKRKEQFTVDKIQENVELQGACFVFSPLFVKESAFAFEELTFMYGEEALLSLRCAKNNWKTVYNPEIKIYHAEKIVTKLSQGNNLDKEIFLGDNHVKAIRQICNYLDKMKEGNTE